MPKSINILALDKDFQVVSILAYSNLQWTRKYYESGKFSLTIPSYEYQSSMKYIYTKDRPEMGLITQRNYIVNGQKETYNLSGYFLENQLNKRIVYKRTSATNITNEPSWVSQSGKAETVAYKYFDAFKDVKFTYDGKSYQSLLDIEAGTDQKRGKTADHQRNGEQLGSKIYTILKPSEMSYRVAYDFVNNKQIFSVWSGVDRTQSNTENNNTIVFSTKFGNVKNPNVLIDETNYYNAYAVTTSSGSDGDSSTYVNVERASGETEYDDSYLAVSGTLQNQNLNIINDDNSTVSSSNAVDEDSVTLLYEQGHEKLLEKVKKLNIDFDALTGSYEYMKDFDLGDKCSIEIPEISLSADAVLIGCYEVIKNGTNTLTLEFGTPIVRTGGIQ